MVNKEKFLLKKTHQKEKQQPEQQDIKELEENKRKFLEGRKINKILIQKFNTSFKEHKEYLLKNYTKLLINRLQKLKHKHQMEQIKMKN